MHEDVAKERGRWFSTYRTGHSRMYIPPANAVIFPNADEAAATALVAALKTGHYFTLQTRVVFLDFTV